MTSITNDQNIQEWSSVKEEIIENFGDEGDFSRQHQLNPAIFSLLGDIKDKSILDAGSGTCSTSSIKNTFVFYIPK